MKGYIVKKTKKKGFGLFAAREIKKGEKILHLDLSKRKSYSLKEIAKHPKREEPHWDYVGRGRYVLDHSPASYMNHSCNPNCYYKSKSIGMSDIYAFRDIKKGEELTHDYGVAAIDQFGKKGFWKMKCHCGSKNCRKIITGDFFKLPKRLQRKYWPNLPPSIRRKFRNKFIQK